MRFKTAVGFFAVVIVLAVLGGGAVYLSIYYRQKQAVEKLTLAEASEDFVFAASVASFGMLLRSSEHVGDFTFEAVAEMAQGSISEDPRGYRTEFVALVDRAIELKRH